MADPTIIEITVPNPIAVTTSYSPLPEIIEIDTPGEQGPPGPDPWLEPIQTLIANGGTLPIDYALGKHCRIALQATTQISVFNWPTTNHIARLTLKIDHNGTHALTWAAAILWENGLAPVLSLPGRTWIILSTDDGGATIDGFLSGLTHVT